MTTRNSTKAAASTSTETEPKSAPKAAPAEAAETQQVSTKISDKEADAFLASLMDDNQTKALVANLDQRIETHMKELARLEQARAKLTGESLEEEEEEPAAAPRRRKARVSENGSESHQQPDHASWIAKAIGGGDVQKAEIADALEGLGHQMEPGTLSTYLNNMTKRGQLIATKLGPKRSKYRLNKKYAS